MSRYTIDAYAWIEYFAGTEKGKTVATIVEDPSNILFTNAVTSAEIISKFIRLNKDPSTAAKAIRILSKIDDADFDCSSLAGTLHAQMKSKISDFGLADAFVLATSKRHQTKILTGDPHFKSLSNVILI
ncbi:PIN domain-containing protein [Candidatus Micrarchaeota archaeon]|nr:PIN domain-containing protein [Candidatus Micrarchaeota archaeon]